MGSIDPQGLSYVATPAPATLEEAQKNPNLEPYEGRISKTTIPLPYGYNIVVTYKPTDSTKFHDQNTGFVEKYNPMSPFDEGRQQGEYFYDPTTGKLVTSGPYAGTPNYFDAVKNPLLHLIFDTLPDAYIKPGLKSLSDALNEPLPLGTPEPTTGEPPTNGDELSTDPNALTPPDTDGDGNPDSGTVPDGNEGKRLLSTPEGDVDFGGGGNDSVSSSLSDDYYVGGGGNDNLFAGLGNNNDGNDTILGGSGSDVLNGGGGNNYLDGGSDNDGIFAGDGNDIAFGGSGNDRIYVGGGNNLIDGGSGNEDIVTGDGNDTIFGGSGNDFIGSGLGQDEIDGGDGNDTIRAFGENNTVNGGNGDDNITGVGDLSGGAGNDFIRGRGTNDNIDGGDGNDNVAGTGNISGGSGNDNVSGTGNLSGGDGNDLVSGQDGNDIVNGGKGQDTLIGGKGADTYVNESEIFEQPSIEQSPIDEEETPEQPPSERGVFVNPDGSIGSTNDSDTSTDGGDIPFEEEATFNPDDSVIFTTTSPPLTEEEQPELETFVVEELPVEEAPAEEPSIEEPFTSETSEQPPIDEENVLFETETSTNSNTPSERGTFVNPDGSISNSSELTLTETEETNSEPILNEDDFNSSIESDDSIFAETEDDIFTGDTENNFVDTGDENDTLLGGTNVDPFESLGEVDTENENTDTVFASDISLGVQSNPEELDPNSDDEIVNSFSPTEDTI
jgi:Ca2+-binding RTX toxin-like protein